MIAMIFCRFTSSRCKANCWATAVLCLFVVSPQFGIVVSAEENSDKAGRMLEGLKQRSAAERWKRVKGQYPVDPPIPRRTNPSPLPLDPNHGFSEGELPPAPAPETGLAIPRLTAIPSETGNDWILSTRQPVLDATLDASVDPSIGSLPSPEANLSNDDENLTVIDPRATARIANRNVDAKVAATEKGMMSSARSPLDRTMSDIDPYYDRDEDQDIREFAMKKGREFDIPFDAKTFTERMFPPVTLAWEATNFYHYPLYFADPALERYGHTYHPWIQPMASIGRAGAQFVLLPYQMTINPPCKEDYPLGWYRPGECAPKLHYQIPLNAHAAVVEAVVVTGLFFVIP